MRYRSRDRVCACVLLGGRLAQVADYTTMQVSDPVFTTLNDLKTNLSPNNQKLVPALIELFVSFQNKFFEEFQVKFESMTLQFKDECLATCKAKDEKIAILEKTCKHLEVKLNKLTEKLDDEDAYIRRESLIFSGSSLPACVANESCVDIVTGLLKDELGIIVPRNEISVTHRLGRKPTSTIEPDRRSIVAKFCRRDRKRDIILACRTLKKKTFFANESLTPVRQKVSRALRKARKENDLIKGVTSIDGRVFVFTKNPIGSPDPAEDGVRQRNDIRHCVNSLEKLEEFCQEYLQVSAEKFLT